MHNEVILRFQKAKYGGNLYQCAVALAGWLFHVSFGLPWKHQIPSRVDGVDLL